MTTTTVENGPTTDTDATEGPSEAEKQAALLDSLNEFGKAVYFGMGDTPGLKDSVDAYNSIAAKLQQVGGDDQQILENLRGTSQHPQVVEWRAALEKIHDRQLEIESARDELIKTVLIPAVKADSGVDVPTLNSEADALKVKIDAGFNFLKQMAQIDAADLGLKLARRSNRSGKTNTGAVGEIRRIRGYNYYTDGKLSAMGSPKVSNMAAVGKDVKLDTKSVQDAFFTEIERNGVERTDTENFPAEVNFTLTVGDTTHTIKAVKIPAGAE